MFCNWIYNHENDGLRSTLSQMLETELHAKRINESSYSVSQNFSVREINERLNNICLKCKQDGYEFREDDFVKFYCSALFADSKCDSRERGMLYEYVIELR